ncbi:MAG: Gldg family protein [bacterium]
MNLRRVALGSSFFIEAGLLLAAIIALNIFGCYNSSRLDLTQDKRYTLSEASRNVVANLDEITNVRAYISSELDPRFQPARDEILDILHNYEAAGNDKFRLTIIDPGASDFDPAKDNLEMKGIEPIRFQVKDKGEYSEKIGYLGIEVTRLTKSEVIKQALPTNLEYDLTAAIVRLSKKETETGKISIVQGHDSPSMEDPAGIQEFAKTLREARFTVFSTTLDDKTEIPSTVQTLIVDSPSELSDFDEYQIDQFLLRGGNVIYFVNRVQFRNEQGGEDLRAEPKVVDYGGHDLLESYGVRVEPLLLGDQASEQLGSYFPPIRYPLWLKVPNSNLSQTDPAVNRLNSIQFPWASPITVLDENVKAQPEVAVDVLAHTTPAAWAMDPTNKDKFKGLLPGAYKDIESFPGDSKEYPVAVQLTGKFTSFFKGKPDPVGSRSVSKDRPRIDASEKPGRLIVIGTGKFLEGPAGNQQTQQPPGWWGQFQDTQIFMLNLMDALNLGNDLINLRSRNTIERPLEKEWVQSKNMKDKVLDPKDWSTITLLNLLVMPFLIAVLAMGRFGLKASQKRSYEKQMREALALDPQLTAAERAEIALSARVAKSGYALPIIPMVVLALVLGGTVLFVMKQNKAQAAAVEEIRKKEEALFFPTIARNAIQRIENIEILGKTVFEKRDGKWYVGHVGYEPNVDFSEIEAKKVPPDQFAPADQDQVESMLTAIEEMKQGEFLSETDENTIQMYVGRIGADFVLYDDKDKIVARFVVGKNAEDFSGTYVQLKPLEKKDHFPVYKVKGYLEPIFKKKNYADWLDRHIYYGQTADNIQKVTLTTPAGPVVVEKQGDNFVVTQPDGIVADPKKLKDWVAALVDFQVGGWLEDQDRFMLDQTPPDWTKSTHTLVLELIGGGGASPPLQVIQSDAYAQLGGAIARYGAEGGVFKLSPEDLKKLTLNPADIAPGAPAATPPAAETPPPAGAAGTAPPPPAGGQ